MTKPICLITGKQNKIEQFQLIIGDHLNWTYQKMSIPEIQGEPLQIAVEKCKLAAKLYDGPVLTDDGGLYFNAWNKLPGIYVNDFIHSVGIKGMIKMLESFDDKTCYAEETYCYCAGPGQEPVAFVGRCDGKVVEPRGSKSSGFDAIIEVNGKTFAEMDVAEKITVNHRGKAGKQLVEFLLQSTKQ